jgi:hypothetical protein
MDLKEKDDREGKKAAAYGARQQGIENQLAKVQQHKQEIAINIAKDQGEMIKAQNKRLGLPDQKGKLADIAEKSDSAATKSGQDKSHRQAETQHETIVKTLKDQTQKWKTEFANTTRERAQVKHFQGALKTDIQLFQGKMQLLTTLPGMQTLLTGIKFLLARFLLTFDETKIGKWLFGEKDQTRKEATETIVNAFTGGAGEQLELDFSDTGDEEPTGKRKKLKADGTPDMRFSENQGFVYRMNKALKKGLKSLSEGWGKFTNNMGKAKDNIVSGGETVKGNISDLGTAIMTGFGNALKASTKAFAAAGMWLVTAITGLTAAEVVAAGGISTVAGGLLMASLPFIAIGVAIALLIAGLVILGMWLYSQKDVIKEKWEIFKQKFVEGWDKIVAVGQLVKNWFSDKGTSIKLTIQHMIAVITDGIAAIVNGLIEGMKSKFPKLAKYFNIDQYKMEGGAVDAVAKQRADFEAMKQNRDMNTAGTAVLNAQGEVTGGSVQGSGSTVVKGGDTINNKQSYITEKTKSNDDIANGTNGPTM